MLLRHTLTRRRSSETTVLRRVHIIWFMDYGAGGGQAGRVHTIAWRYLGPFKIGDNIITSKRGIRCRSTSCQPSKATSCQCSKNDLLPCRAWRLQTPGNKVRVGSQMDVWLEETHSKATDTVQTIHHSTHFHYRHSETVARSNEARTTRRASTNRGDTSCLLELHTLFILLLLLAFYSQHHHHYNY